MVKIKNSLSTKLLSMLLAISILIGALPPTMVSVFALENENVAQIGDTYYETLEEAINAVTAGENCVTPSEVTEIKLLKDTSYGFDVGKSNGSVTKNISLDLGENTLTLKPAVGSTGTTSNGIRVLAYSKLAISNGTIVCPDDAESNIKTGIANYGELILDDVQLKSGALTLYTINNRGKLTLSGMTSVENGKVEQTAGAGDYIAITNDPYNLYYTTNVDAELICDSADVSVGTVQVERYDRTSSNKGIVKLDISNGTIGRIIEDGNDSVDASYDLSGGTIGVYTDAELKAVLDMVTSGAEYTCPENAVTIKLMGNGTFAHGFDVGTSNGKSPKNIVLDLNGKSLTLNPAVGSVGTVSNGIRVLSYSKLCIKNGTLICPDETEANIKTGIANYSDLTLDDVIVKAGALTQYTINNRGKLTLSGATKVENGRVAPNDYEDMAGVLVAITNDPYTTYNTSNDNNASLICDSKDVVVGNVQLECYGKVDKNIILDINTGSFGKLLEPETSGSVKVDSSKLVGGTFANNVSNYISADEYSVIYDETTQTYKVNTLKEVTDFAFETETPLNQWVGAKYTNIAKSQVSNGAVTYAITEGTDVAEIDENSGEVTFLKLGTIKVVASLARTDSYKAATAKYTVTSVKVTQNILNFAITAPTITYNPDKPTFTNEASGGSGDGKIKYEIVGNSDCATVDANTGVVTIIKAGQVTIKATKESDDLYEENTTTYVLTINPATQTDLKVDAPESITYIKDTPQSILSVSGGNGDGEVTYSIISGSEFATIDRNTGKITTLKASNTAAGVCGVITVRIEKAGDDCYNAATPVDKNITINFADQTGFGFEVTEADKLVVTYNDSNNKFTNKASGGQSTGAISYEIIVGTDVADINVETGELTIKQAGQVTVKAVKSGDTCYNATYATYTLTVNPDTPEFTIDDVDLIYGVKEYQINVDTILGDSGKYVYSVDDNNIGASVDEDGKITFENSTGKVGSITVKVKKEADDKYVELEKEFTLTVSYHIPDAQPTVSGSTKNNSGWYTGIVTITAPDGYSISYSNDLTGTSWSEGVTINTDGVNSKNVFLKKGNEISDAIPFENIKIDTVVPTNVKIDYNTSFFEKALETITFGIYKAKTIDVTLTATDVTSGIDYFTYDIGNGDVVVSKASFTKDENGVAEYTFQISAEFRNKVEMSATDVAGWTSELTETDHYLVVDNISPVLDVKYDFAGSKNTLDTYYTNDDVTVKFKIKDDNFYLRAEDPVFMVGSMKIALTWVEDKAEGVWKAEQLLSGDNTYNLSLTFSDASDNEMNAYAKTIIIDSSAPVISSDYGKTVPVKENIFNKSRAATFTITESNFNSADVVLSVDAKDITGATVDISDKAYAEYVKNDANWTHNGNIHTIELPAFDIDAIYTVDIAYTDLAKNPASDYPTDEFVFDETILNADDVTVEYSTSIVDKILENITFGFYKTDVIVTLTAEDVTSGIDYFVVTYVNEDGKNNSNKATYTTEKLDAVQDTNDKSVFTATHTISANARGTVTVQVVDNATNDTEKVEQHVIVADTIAPGLEYEWTFTADQVREYNNIYYTKGETKVKFTITEANFDLSLKQATGPAGREETVAPAPVLTVNDVAQDVTWTQLDGTDKWETEITLTGNDDYVVELSYTDRSTNAMNTYTKEVHIDNVAPEFDVSYSNNEARNSNNYKADRVATIKVTEHNFKAEEVVLNVTAKDITGATVDISAKGYAEYAKNAANWTQDGDEWTLVLPKFDIDAIYNITLNYTDLAENAATEYATEFVLDKTIANADNVSIEYSESIVDKILETVTFGFYKGDVEVKVTVKDQTAGVEYFEITYTQADGKNNSNKATYTTEKLTAVQDANDKTVFTATHTIEAEARGTVSVNLIDKAGNTTGSSEEYVVVADTIAPGLEYEWTFTDDQVREYNNIYYTKGETKVKFTITEANFDLSLKTADDETAAPAPVLTVNGVAQNITWTQIDGTDKWETEITLTGNDDYVVELSYTDRSTNAMDTYTKEVHIDNVAPEFEVTYDNNEARNDNNYKADRVATIKVKEHNFKTEEVVLVVTAKDITGAPVDISAKGYAEYAKNAANWTQDGDVWTLNTEGMKFDIDAIYNITLNYTDLSENAATEYATEFVLDKTKSSNIKIEYSESIVDKVLETITFGFYKPDVIVTVTAQDDTAGVEYFKITYTKQDGTSTVNKDSYTTEELLAVQDTTNKNIFTATHTIPANARGTVSVELIDKAGNGNNAANPVVLVVDKVNPTREVIYTPYKILDAATMLEVKTYKEGDDSILYYKNSAVVTFKITEANLDLSLKDEATKPVIKVNNVPVSVDWSNDGDVWTATYTINGNGDYVVTMTYTDLSTNEMVSYESCKIAIDSDVPVIDVKYTDGTPNQTIDGRKYYKTTQTVNVTIDEHNFRADDVVLTVTAKDIQGNPVDISSKKYADYAKNRDNWNHNGDVHTLKTDGMVFDIDAIYTFDIVYDDIIDNFAADYAQDDFVVDHAMPTNLKIEYSESIVDKIIETITFGFYKPEVTVTITADDITSGVDYFDWTYTKEDGTSDKNTEELGARISTSDIEYSNNGLSAKATFKVPAQARGYITATVTDRSGNSTSKTDKNNITVVVDNIAPTISVNYEADNADTKVQFTDDKYATVDTFEKATYAYYNGDVTANIVINEANFFEGVEAKDGVIYNVGIKLTKTDDNGNKTVYEYLPTGAVQKYDGATPKYITWANSGDEHSFSINYADNADYVLEIEYTDLSTNDANISANDGKTVTKSYTSKVVTVDKIAPVVDVKYSNEKVIHTIDGREYYDAEQTATITVKEHNFRADDFVATVVAQDIVKADVNVENFKATLSDDSKWTQNGNTYTITIKYSVDANYSFDYEYKDLAQNAAAAYDEDLFTVDKTAPKNLTVSYSQSVADKILETITFGYYNAKVTVTITAEDDTAGIYRFEYAYLKSEGVSSVNAELLKAAIEEAAFTVEGNKSTATFEIPKDVLQSENQFNGTVKFVAFDRSENNTEKADTRRVIVDNIAPTATITYNEPVQRANDISYYAGNIDAKIVINEANFYSEDVVVKVNDKAVAVNWVNDSVDVHTGTFTLTEDGDYIVTVEYKDRSANEMTKYTSNRLTLDTKAPTVNVSNIKINSANKDEKYGFTITANDINLDATSFKPVLTATIRKEDGSYGTKTVPLGEMKTVEAGKTYTFTVDNLEDDAVYSLVCTLKDMSGNAYSKIALSDGKEYEEVRFSINRNGSTFAVDKNTDTLVNQYYVYSVDEDVVIEEVNVDPVETYVVKLNGEVLTEGADYTSTLSDKAGEWSKRTYVISKELFKSEGEYSIVVESTDKADTTAYSDVKNLNVAFVVDQTAPVLTISGLENGGRYQVEEQTVTVIPTDDGGRLYSMKVIVLNSDGEPLKDANGKDISVRFEMSGEEFLTYLTENNGKITFTVPEGLENQVQIICNDCAVNADGKTNEYNETYTKVTVSQSGWIIFYANKPLFYGSIAGVLLLVGGIIFLIFLKKRKKETK